MYATDTKHFSPYSKFANSPLRCITIYYPSTEKTVPLTIIIKQEEEEDNLRLKYKFVQILYTTMKHFDFEISVVIAHCWADVEKCI